MGKWLFGDALFERHLLVLPLGCPPKPKRSFLESICSMCMDDSLALCKWNISCGHWTLGFSFRCSSIKTQGNWSWTISLQSQTCSYLVLLMILQVSDKVPNTRAIPDFPLLTLHMHLVTKCHQFYFKMLFPICSLFSFHPGLGPYESSAKA